MDEYRQSLVGRALADVLQELEGNGNIDAKAGDTLFALFDAAVREDFAAAAPRKQKKKPSDDSEVQSENEDEPQQPRLFTHESMELHGRVESYNRFLDKWSVVAALNSEGSDNSDSLSLDKTLVPLPSSSTRVLIKLHRPPPS